MHIDIFLGNSKFECSNLGGPPGSLEFSGDNACSFKQFSKIILGESMEIIPENYKKLTEHFVSSSFVAPLMLPRNQLENSIKRAENFVKKTIEEPVSLSYLESWLRISEFLSSLSRARVDANKLATAAEGQHEGPKRMLETFLPDVTGLAKRVVYNTSNSVTGRLTVETGPQILLAPKVVRHCFVSSFEGGSVYEIDFRSIEPRIAMISAGVQAPDDVYQDLLDEFPSLSREAAKAVTLTALYGGQPARVAEVVGDLGTARKSITFVRSHFSVERLERQLRTAAECGIVRNALGRPLREATHDPRIRMNHYLQSTAAELSILLFRELCERVPAVKPIFVIHDALIVDVPKCAELEFFQSCERTLWQGVRMPMSIKNLADN